MTDQQFAVLQEYLLQAYGPFIRFGLVLFLIAIVCVAILIVGLIVGGEIASRFRARMG